MGNQLCSQQTNSMVTLSEISRHQTISLTDPETLQDNELQQEFDNPSRTFLDGGFLKTSITASNQRLQDTSRSNGGIVQQGQMLSIYRIQSSQLSIGKDQWDQIFRLDTSEDEIERQNEEDQEQQEQTPNRKRKASVQSRIIQPEQPSIQNKQTEQILFQISGFVMSEKKLFETKSISKEDFIKFRKEKIEKHYSFVEKIGQGSFGNVFKVFHKGTQEFRAIKILKRSTISKIEVNKMTKQVEILKKLDHPHILKIYEVFSHQNNYYIVTEFCEGGTLSRYLRTETPPPIQNIKLIFLQLVTAVSYIHRLGVVHRDIKLDNILLKSPINSKNREVDIRLIDYGLSKELKVKRCKEREKIGTHTYMAPEVIEGVYSTKCDMWSLGIVLVTMITGSNPFKGRSKQETFLRIKSQNINFASNRWKDVSVEAKQLVLGLLEKDPRARLSCEQVLSSRWLATVQEEKQQKPIMNIVARRLYDYYSGNNFVSLVESYIAYTATPEKQLREFSRYFSLLDENKDGLIGKKQLQKVLQCSNILTEPELEYVKGKVDALPQEGINFTQFVARLADKSKMYSKSSLLQAFQYLDENGNGFIEKKEIKKILKSFDVGQLSYILTELDQNQDDRISLDEFIQYFRSHK